MNLRVLAMSLMNHNNGYHWSMKDTYLTGRGHFRRIKRFFYYPDILGIK